MTAATLRSAILNSACSAAVDPDFVRDPEHRKRAGAGDPMDAQAGYATFLCLRTSIPDRSGREATDLKL
jgi:hypothetical protein